MTAAEIIAIIAQVIKTAVEVGPGVIATLQDAEPFAKAIYDSLIAGKPVTPEQIAALDAKLKALSDELQQPLPPDTP